jgi:hypothetical protein
MKKLLIILILNPILLFGDSWEKINATNIHVQNIIQYFCYIEKKHAVYVTMYRELDAHEYASTLERLSKKYKKEDPRRVLQEIQSDKGIFVFNDRNEAWRFFQVFNEPDAFAGGFKALIYDENGFLKANTY